MTREASFEHEVGTAIGHPLPGGGHGATGIISYPTAFRVSENVTDVKFVLSWESPGGLTELYAWVGKSSTSLAEGTGRSPMILVVPTLAAGEYEFGALPREGNAVVDTLVHVVVRFVGSSDATLDVE